MKTVSTAVMRELDRKTIQDFKIPGTTLMDKAGRGVARCTEELLERSHGYSDGVLVIAGHGNNGGDAFVAARYLKQWGWNVAVWLAASVPDIKGDARIHFKKMKACKIPVRSLPAIEDWNKVWFKTGNERCPAPALIIDGLLGTGIEGSARDPVAGAIRYINMLSEKSLVIAIDVPSGLNSDTGKAAGEAVRADLTVTMGLPKLGLVQPEAIDFVGRLQVIDIGIPTQLISELEAHFEYITQSDIQNLFRRRPRGAHKGNFGHLLIIGGAGGYAGAVSMAAKAALRAGAGLVTVLTPAGIAPIVAASTLEAMVHAAAETDTGSISSKSWPAWRDKLKTFSAVLIGPGMTRHAETGLLARLVLKECHAPVVMDADALNMYEGRMKEFQHRDCPLLLTPHPGEMARMSNCSNSDVQNNRFKTAEKAAALSHSTVILKGAGTVIAEQGQPLQINLSGNPGMATGGTGDVLSGLLAGLLAQGFVPFQAARAAVYLHGLAGDEAARKQTEYGLTAGDLIEHLPYALRRVTPR